MNTKKNNAQLWDESKYAPNWIKMDIDDAVWNDELPLGDEDLYPELDPNEDLDYKNREKMRQ
jgi:hypothetical protein